MIYIQKKQNDLAIIKASWKVSEKTKLKFHNFNSYYETTKKFLTYKKGQKNAIVVSIEKGKESFAWFIGSFTLIYFFIFLYGMMKSEDVAAAAEVVEKLLMIKIWLTINIVGMAIIAYFFTPLFLVATVIGMSLAYILHKLTLKNKNKKY